MDDLVIRGGMILDGTGAEPALRRSRCARRPDRRHLAAALGPGQA